MVDDMDFFIETINPDNPNEYLYDGNWEKMKIIKESIRLKNNRDTTITIRLTHHGPIITDIHALTKSENLEISMAWTGNWLTTEIDALLGLSLATNWNEFSNAVKNYGVPGQNIVYADTKGNIGWRPAVYVPIRKEGSSLLPTADSAGLLPVPIPVHPPQPGGSEDYAGLSNCHDELQLRLCSCVCCL